MKEKWILDTGGTNLIEILSHSAVDSERTYSNDIVEVYNLLGIDAAKELLMKEINEVIDFSGNYVNYRHLSLLCDTMTNKGYLMSIDRFGINRDRDIGPLRSAHLRRLQNRYLRRLFSERLINLRVYRLL